MSPKIYTKETTTTLCLTKTKSVSLVDVGRNVGRLDVTLKKVGDQVHDRVEVGLRPVECRHIPVVAVSRL